MEYRDMSYAQIKNVFRYVDNDHDNVINDSEWFKFYDEFIVFF